MADPITIITTVFTVIGGCKAVIDNLAQFYDKFQSARETLEALTNECNITVFILTEAERVLKENQGLFNAAGGRQVAEKLFANAVNSVHETIRTLTAETESVRTEGKWRAGAQYAFNEASFKTLQTTLHDRRQQIGLVVNTINMQLLSQINRRASSPLVPSHPVAATPAYTRKGESGMSPSIAPLSATNPKRSGGKKLNRASMRKAIQDGDAAKVKRLLEEGIDPDTPIECSHTPLQLAASHGRCEIIRLLLSFGAEIDRGRRTPLIVAITAKKEAAAITLADAGADVSCTDTNGDTALCSAVFHNMARCVDRLISKGADVKSSGKDGISALIKCLSNRDVHMGILRSLLDHGARPDSPSLGGVPTALHVAAAASSSLSTAVLGLMLRTGIDLEVKDNDGGTPLIVALSSGNFEAAKMLVNAGANPNTQLSGGYSALMITAQDGPVGLLELALTRGGSIAALDQDGESALHWACRRKDDDAEHLAALLRHRADVDCRDKKGRSPLHTAINAKNTRIVTHLLKNGGNVHGRDLSGDTPLSYAVKQKDTSFCQLLVSHGADVAPRGSTGPSPLELAIRKPRDLGVIRILISSPSFDPKRDLLKASGSRIFRAAAKSGDVATMCLLLSKGADPHRKDLLGASTLHYAARGGGILAATFVLGLGVDLNAQDNRGITPLMEAAVRKDVDVVRWLLELGADVSLKARRFRRRGRSYDGGDACSIAKQQDCAAVHQLILRHVSGSHTTHPSSWTVTTNQRERTDNRLETDGVGKSSKGVALHKAEKQATP